jgi:hypothetical protein
MDARAARPISITMATRLHFASGRELTVAQSEDGVVLAVRRDVPNPVRLGDRGATVHVNWDHVESFAEDDGPPAAQ